MLQGLDGVKVVELGTTVSAPYSSQILGQLGADVIKIEAPGGDPFRSSADIAEAGISGYFAMCNAGKRSLCLDLKTEEGKEIFRQLVSDTDVVIENFRPGVVDRLGVGYEAVTDITEDIVYCSVSAYGQEGPWSQRPGFDPIIQGESGLMSITGEKGGAPVRVGIAVVDLMTATWSVIAIQNALLQRHLTGEGTYLDMSMFDVAVSALTKRAAQYFITDENPDRMGTEDSWSVPYGAYPTADDRLILIGAGRQGLWETMCELIGREDLIKNENFRDKKTRVENREELNEILYSEFRKRPLEEWLELLQDEIPAGPVATVEEAVTNEHSQHRDVETQVSFQDGALDLLNFPICADGNKHEFESPPPNLGEHNREILKQLDYSPEEVAQLESAKIVRQE